jgi:hypothetical protein
MENNTLCYIWVEKWVNFQKLSNDSVVFQGGEGGTEKITLLLMWNRATL